MRDHRVVDWQTVQGPVASGTPVLSLAASPAGLLAGGLTGVASLPDGRRMDTGVGPVTALAADDGWLFAGGADGVARSGDGGRTWSAATAPLGGSPVSALLTVPGFERHGVVLAGTVDAGVLRSQNRGRDFTAAGFGLPSREVTGLCALPDGTVLTSTAAGVCRDRGTGRAWQPCPGPVGVVMTAVAAAPDGTAYATAEDGMVWRSAPGEPAFEPWQRGGAEPAGLAVVADGTVLTAGPDGVVAVTGSGARRLTADPALSLLATPPSWITGTATGWSRDGAPATTVAALADVDRLLAGAAMWVVSRYSGAWLLGADGWVHVALPPVATLDAVAGTRGDLVTAGAYGVVLSRPGSQESLLPAPAGRVAWRGGTAFAAEPGGTLWLSRDDGRRWQRRSTPAGAVPPLALHAAPDSVVLAVTRDDGHGHGVLWQSGDDGFSWQRCGVRSPGRAGAAFLGDPATAVLGRRVHRRAPTGEWVTDGEFGADVRRAVAVPGGPVVAVTTDGIEVLGRDVPIPVPEHLPGPRALRDITVADGSLYLLDQDGHVSRLPFR